MGGKEWYSCEYTHLHYSYPAVSPARHRDKRMYGTSSSSLGRQPLGGRLHLRQPEHITISISPLPTYQTYHGRIVKGFFGQLARKVGRSTKGATVAEGWEFKHVILHSFCAVSVHRS